MIRLRVQKKFAAVLSFLFLSHLLIPPFIEANPVERGSLKLINGLQKITSNLFGNQSQRGWYCGTPDLILKNSRYSPPRLSSLLHHLKRFLIPTAHAEKRPLHQEYQKAISSQLSLTKTNLRRNLSDFPSNFSSDHPFRLALQDTSEVVEETTTVISGESDIRIVEITEQEYKTDPRFKWNGKQMTPDALVNSDLPNQIFVVREKFLPAFEEDSTKAAHEFFAIVAHEVAHMLFDENVSPDQREGDPGLYALTTEFRARLVDATIFVVNDNVHDMTDPGGLPGLSALLAEALLNSNDDPQFPFDNLAIGFMENLLSFFYGYGDLALYLLRQMNQDENKFIQQEAERMHLPQGGGLKDLKKNVGKDLIKKENKRWLREFAKKILRSDFMEPLKAREADDPSGQGKKPSSEQASQHHYVKPKPTKRPTGQTGQGTGGGGSGNSQDGGEWPNPEPPSQPTGGGSSDDTTGEGSENASEPASGTSGGSANAGSDSTTGSTTDQPTEVVEPDDNQAGAGTEASGAEFDSGSGSPSIEITSNPDGSFTATNGTTGSSETFSDPDGDGTYCAEGGWCINGQPAAGTYTATCDNPECSKVSLAPTGGSSDGSTESAECSGASDCKSDETCNPSTRVCEKKETDNGENSGQTEGSMIWGSGSGGSDRGPDRSDAEYGSGAEGDLQYCLDTASGNSATAGCYSSYATASMKEMARSARAVIKRMWDRIKGGIVGTVSDSGNETEFPPGSPCYGMTESECIEYKQRHGLQALQGDGNQAASAQESDRTSSQSEPSVNDPSSSEAENETSSATGSGSNNRNSSSSGSGGGSSSTRSSGGRGGNLSSSKDKPVREEEKEPARAQQAK